MEMPRFSSIEQQRRPKARHTSVKKGSNVKKKFVSSFSKNGKTEIITSIKMKGYFIVLLRFI